MNELLLVMLGGAVGSGLRYGAGLLIAPSEGTFPWSTFLVNVIGSFMLGALVGITVHTDSVSRQAMLLLGTGLCGGFTTYSTFAVESTLFAQNGQSSMLAIYVGATVVCCTAAALAGILSPQVVSR